MQQAAKRMAKRDNFLTQIATNDRGVRFSTALTKPTYVATTVAQDLLERSLNFMLFMTGTNAEFQMKLQKKFRGEVFLFEVGSI